MKVWPKDLASSVAGLLACFLVVGGGVRRAWSQSIETQPQTHGSDIWQGEVGHGFNKDTYEVGSWLGVGLGRPGFGSTTSHDVVLSSVKAGWIFTDVMAAGNWYSGNCELLGELFGGAQFSPEIRYLTGITPFLRYNFATGSRWVPFITCGAGVILTDIGHPDLSGTFQFDPQGGVGTHYFFWRDAAATLEWRWLHISNAGIKEPNHGVNTQMLQLGVSWFF